jgi:hypothetical protein
MLMLAPERLISMPVVRILLLMTPKSHYLSFGVLEAMIKSRIFQTLPLRLLVCLWLF